MKFSTFYFSGTGNTEWAVKKFSDIIVQAGHESSIFAVENIDENSVPMLIDAYRSSDYIGFANPIYGGDMPVIMKNFILRFSKILKNENSKPVYMISTFAYVNGFGPVCAGRLLKNTPFNIVSYVNIRLCNNISRPGLKADIMTGERLEKRKEAAEKELKKMAAKLISAEKYITGIGPYLIPNILIRKKAAKSIIYNYKSLSIDMKACSKCLLCVKNCPTHSIIYSQEGFEFLPGCTACMRCYNYCPKYAVLFNNEYADPKIYKRYHGPVQKA